MTTSEKRPTASRRIDFLDNLRTVAILLVVVLHAGLVYEASGIGASFWIVDDPATNNLSGIVNLILDIFVMATIFFVSGYLAPASLEARGGWAFLRAKARRLLLPWAVAVVTLIPAYKVVFLHSRALPQEHWTTYFHFSNGIWGMNWLWFLPVLFLFSALYMPLARIGWAPTRLSLEVALPIFVAIGFANSLAFDLLGLRGWTKTFLVDFQNERLVVYFLSFLLGSLCFHRGVFTTRPGGKKLYILAGAVSWIPINVYLLFLLAPWIRPGTVLLSPVADRVVVWLAFYLSLLSLAYVLIQSFWRYLDRTGPAWRELSRNSYPVYIIHTVVIGVVALPLLGFDWPSLFKYAVLTVLAYLASNALASLYRAARTRFERRGAAGSGVVAAARAAAAN